MRMDPGYTGYWDGTTWHHSGDGNVAGCIGGGARGDFWVVGTVLIHHSPSGFDPPVQWSTLGIDTPACDLNDCPLAIWASSTNDVWVSAGAGHLTVANSDASRRPTKLRLQRYALFGTLSFTTAVVALSTVVACGARTELDVTLTRSSAGGNAGTECPGTALPAMVRLPEGYCIDSTEVTRAQYQGWLSTNPSTASQISVCSTNTTFTPDASCMERACRSNCENHPQVCVDWCDANAYCNAAGKRLCGKIGGGSLAGYGGEFIDVNLSQWFNACSSHATQSFTYGKAYAAGICNSRFTRALRNKGACR